MINVYKDSETLLTTLADFVITSAREAIAQRGRFNFVLSGGSSPKKLYRLLASFPESSAIPWQKVFFFFGDERYVPPDHDDSNFLMAKKSLFNPLGIPDDQIFAINTTLSPQDAAIDYERRIKSHFDDGDCRFDLILLGLGDNSHTASLFPHTSVLHEHEGLVKEIYVDEVGMYRITFTAPLINAARQVVFLVYGSGKAAAVHHILKGKRDFENYPAQLIQPDHGELIWFLDEASAGVRHL